jgi:1-acyl-sn-glycerol-3-phosphate acyltransferase
MLDTRYSIIHPPPQFRRLATELQTYNGPHMGSTRSPRVPPTIPTRGWWLGRLIGRLILAVARWSFAGRVPDIPKGVIIVAPHTSNWDFVIGAAAMLALDLDLRFLGKHTLFKGPLGILMRFLGGIPIDRSRPGSGVVEEMGDRMRSADRLLLALAPEGTRSSVERWKTGFHRIALAGGVPIAPVTLDYGAREIRFGPLVVPSDDLESDVVELQNFFYGSRGRRET